MSLPVGHEGGSLVCRHGDKTESFASDSGMHVPRPRYFSWSLGSDPEAERQEKNLDYVVPNQFGWAAFFGDVEHEVAKVGVGQLRTHTPDAGQLGTC